MYLGGLKRTFEIIYKTITSNTIIVKNILRMKELNRAGAFHTKPKLPNENHFLYANNKVYHKFCLKFLEILNLVSNEFHIVLHMFLRNHTCVQFCFTNSPLPMFSNITI